MSRTPRISKGMLTIIAVSILLGLPTSTPAFAESINWIYSYEDALKLAASSGKPIMAGFYTTWCGYCRKLDQVTYVDSAVVAISKDYVCLKVDGEKRRDVAYSYGVGKYPTIVFMDPSGSVIWREFGYREPEFLARRMREVLSVYRSYTIAEPYIRRAFEEASRGRAAEGLSILDEGIAKHPDEPRLYAARSSVYRYMGARDRALADLDRAVSMNQKDDGMLTMRGMLRYEMKDPQKAMEDFDKAIAVNPYNYEAYNGRAAICLERNDPDLALKNLNTALLINPKHAGAYFNRGVTYGYKGQLSKAVSDFTMAIKLDPKLINAYSNRANVYMHLKQYDKAWNDVRTIEKSGYKMGSEFMAELRKLSGRDQ